MDNHLSERVTPGFYLRNGKDISSSKYQEPTNKNSDIEGQESEIQRIRYPKTAELMTEKINVSTSEAAKEDVNLERVFGFFTKTFG
jgi:hypothetical protein